jgi:hypothetical protein
VVRHRLFKTGASGPEGALAVEGFETRVWVARNAGDPLRVETKPIPAAVIARLKQAETEQEDSTI